MYVTEQSNAQVRQTVTHYTVTALPASIDERYAYPWNITVEHRGFDKWAVVHMGKCLDSDLTWDYEPLPSSRDDEWLASHRFSEDDALRLARKMAPTIVVNGFPIDAAIAKYAQSDREAGK